MCRLHLCHLCCIFELPYSGFASFFIDICQGCKTPFVDGFLGPVEFIYTQNTGKEGPVCSRCYTPAVCYNRQTMQQQDLPSRVCQLCPF